MNQIDSRRSVAEIVLDHPVTARIFRENRIDYCCSGDVPVEEACAKKGVDLAGLLVALESAIAERADQPAAEDARALETPALLARIVDRHHGYLRKALPWLVPLAIKVARVHGDKEERLIGLRDQVIELSDLLLPHLDREEQILFPALVAEGRDEALLRREFAALNEEHLAVGAQLEEVRRLSDDFAPPSWACNSYRTLFSELFDLEGEVLRQVHLEKHVLVPRFA